MQEVWRNIACVTGANQPTCGPMCMMWPTFPYGFANVLVGYSQSYYHCMCLEAYPEHYAAKVRWMEVRMGIQKGMG